MDIKILHQLEGAADASGLTVVIDVFRAFTLECYMYAAGAAAVYPTAGIEESWALKKQYPDAVLAGERNGIMVEGFDYGNAPSQFEHLDLRGRTVIHTTSAGVQGLAAVSKADEVLTGSLVNASAIARYIQQKNPAAVSLVAMGWNAVKDTEEDILCAEYIRSLLEGKPLADIHKQAYDLRLSEGKKFFDPARQSVFPERDFWLCIDVDRFDHIIRVERRNGRLETDWLKV